MKVKTSQIIALFGTVFILFACSKKEEKKAETTTTTDTKSSNSNDSSDTLAFDINQIPVSENNLKETSKFPYIELPSDLKYQNSPLTKDFDELYFPLGANHDFVKLSGKTFKANIVKSDNNTDWSLAAFEKNYDDAITKLGGKLIYNGKANNEQTTFLNNNARYLGEEGSIDYWNEPYKVYVIRQINGDNVYIQFYGNTASGAIQILQQEAGK